MAVITLQFGNYSNCVGAHWWNIQESSFCHESTSSSSPEVLRGCLFREGQDGARKEVIYSPRLIAVDLPSNLHSTASKNDMYEEDTGRSGAVGWDGDVQTVVQDTAPSKKFQTDPEEMDMGMPTPKEKLYRLESGVGAWPDYLSPRLHPQSLLPVPIRTAREGPFHCFPQGESLMSDQQFADDFDNRLHYFVEDCDHFQGLHVLSDIHNGFSGLASAVLEGLADEYGARKIAVFACYPTSLDDGQDSPLAVLNSACAVERIVASSAMLLPLSMAAQLWPSPDHPRHLPHLDVKHCLSHHTSAVLASALDTSTLVYRTSHSQCQLVDVAAAITDGGRQVASLGCALPLPLIRGSSLASLLTRPLLTHLTPLTPYHTPTDNLWGQKWVVRGIPSEYSLNPLRPSQSPAELLLSHLADHTPHSQCSLDVVQQPLTTPTLYPHIFTPTTADLVVGRNKHNSAMNSVPMATCLSSCESAHNLLTSLKDNFLRVSSSRHFPFSLSRDSQGDLAQTLDKMCANYRPQTASDLADSDDNED